MASLRSLVVKIGADVTNVEKALASVGESAKTLDAGLKKLGATPIGRQTIADAERLTQSVKGLSDQQQKLANQSVLAARGLEAIGGPARLMRGELDQVAKTVQRGLDAFRALGQQAPVELQKVAAAIEKQQALLKGGGLLGSFAAGLPGGSLLAGGLAGAVTAAGAAFGVAAKQALDYADALTKVSDRTGVDVVALQKLDAIARASGNSLEDIGGAINRFQRNLASNDRTAGVALERIGLSFQQLRGLNPDQQFIAIAKGLQSITDPAQQALLAVELFGKGGAEILPSLKSKVDELANSTVVMSQESVEALDAFGDGVQRLKTSVIAAAGEMIAAFLKVPKAIKDAADALPQSQSDIILQDSRETARLQEALFKGPAAFSEAQKGLTVEETDALAAALKRAADNATTLSSIAPPDFASPEDIARIEAEGRALAQSAEFALKVQAAQRDLFGTDLLERSRVYVAALGDVSKLSKLTASEQASLLSTLRSALDVFAALKQQAPDAFLPIVQALERLQFGAKATVTTIGELAAGIPTLFSPEEFRNIAEGFAADGTLITESLDSMAEHARQTEAAFQQFFGVTAGLSLGLPSGALPLNADQIRDARAELEKTITSTEKWERGTLAVGAALQQLSAISVREFTSIRERILSAAQGVVQLILQIVELTQKIQALTVAEAAARSVGIGFTIATIIASFASQGGVVTPQGVQQFSRGGPVQPQYLGVGGSVLPFLSRGTDTVPAMLTPGEIVLNKAQQKELASALSSGGPVIHNHWAGVVMTPDVYRHIARKATPHVVQNVTENKDGQGSRLRAGLGLRS